MTGRRGNRGVVNIVAIVNLVALAGCAASLQEAVATAPVVAIADDGPTRGIPPVDIFPREFAILYESGEFRPTSPQAARITIDIADYIQRARPDCVYIVGHSDTVGDDASNLELSVARASELAATLRSMGTDIPIYVAGLGETDLARPTPDNVSDYLNRRVSVTFPFGRSDCSPTSQGRTAPYRGFVD